MPLPLENYPMRQSATGRLTVGVLAGWQVYTGMPHSFLKPVLQGIYTAAQEHNCNLLLACGMGQPNDTGVRQLRPAWPKLSPDSDFVPVGPWNTDGLIVIIPLATPTQSRDVQEFRAAGHPLVFVGAGEPGPAVVPDNEGGIAQAVAHLVLNHGHRQIAFIAGLKDGVTDSYYRLQAFRAAMHEYGLEIDPQLVVHGSHSLPGGEQAMEQLLATGLSFTAVLASNDSSCKGAIRALQRAGRRIPKDVAVIGFDDRLENMAHVPLLSSVHYPLRHAGYQSLELLLRHIAGQVAETEVVKVPTRLMARESCGCQPDVAASMALRSFRQQSLEVEPLNLQPLLAYMMSEAVLAEAPSPRPGEIHALCLRLLTAFVSSLEERTDKRFRLVVDEILRQLEEEGDAHAWQGALVVLEGGRRALVENESRSVSQHAEKLLSRAHLLISERARRRSKRYQVEQSWISDNLGWMTGRLFTARNETHILELLAEDLPKLGIQRADLVFFEPEADDPVAWSVLRSIPSLTEAARRFPSRTFPPPDLYPDDQPFCLALVELVNDENQLGFMAFDAANLDPCANVVRLFMAALKNVQLHAQVMELSLRDPVTGLRNRRYFELFLRTEVERCRRYNRDLAVLMIDLDNFKDYNDAFGHLAGDEALRRVGECILSAVQRGVDIVARYGGEEFVVILSETDDMGAAGVAESIRVAVESFSGLKRRLTVSIGVAAAWGETIQAEQLLQRADDALYTAKRLGRNQVYLYPDEVWLAPEPKTVTHKP